MDELTRAIAEAIDEHKYELSGVCACGVDLDPDRDKWGKYKAIWRAHLAAELAPLIEARVREARATELEDVADAFASSANRVVKAKGETERTRYAHEVVEVLRNRADEVRRRNA